MKSLVFILIFLLSFAAGHFYSDLNAANKRIEILRYQARNSVNKSILEVSQLKLLKCEGTAQSLAEEADYIQTVCDCAWQQNSLFDHFLVWSAYDSLGEEE